MNKEKPPHQPFHRNRYMEGARQQREKSQLTNRVIVGLIVVSFLVLVGFLFFISDTDLEESDSQIAADIIVAVAIILVVIIFGATAGAVIGKLRGLRGGNTPFSDRATQKKQADEEQT